MGFNPKVSIIIPVYNGQKYLREAIDSALSQTYKNIEVIVVNDGSRDEGASERIALSYGKKIRYFHKKNGWVASALNLGIKNMTGEYFSWLSHDDVYYPEKIESQIKFLAKKQDKKLVVFSDFDLIDEHSKVYANIAVKDFPSSKFKLELIQSSPISGCSLLIHKSLFDQVGLFDEKNRTAQDYDMWFKLADVTSFVHLKKRIIQSRVHRDQITEHFSDYMIGESEKMYSKEARALFGDSNHGKYTDVDMIKCARGLIHKYCFKSSFQVIKLLKIRNFTTLKEMMLLLFDYAFYRSVQIKHKIFPVRKKQKAVLVITPGFLPMLGGMEDQVYAFSRELISRGYDVSVVTEQSLETLPLYEEMDQIKVYRLKKPKRGRAFGYLGFLLRLSVFLIRRQKKYRFVVIRTFTVQGLAVGALKFFHLFRKPTFITCDTGGEDDELDLIMQSKMKRMYRLFFSQHNYLNALCESNITKFSQIGFDKEKITKIYNGLVTEKYKDSKYPKAVKTFLFLGQLRKQKGLYELLAAMKAVVKECPSARLVIAGDGPEKSGMLSYIKTNKLGRNIDYLGRIGRDQKDSFFASGECLVLPSYSESFGIVLGEAAIYKRHIICTDVADVKKIYPGAIICQKRSVEDLAQKMKDLLSGKRSKLDYDSSMEMINIKKTADEVIGLFEHEL